jgi:hypothetical protein
MLSGIRNQQVVLVVTSMASNTDITDPTMPPYFFLIFDTIREIVKTEFDILLSQENAPDSAVETNTGFLISFTDDIRYWGRQQQKQQNQQQQQQ